MDEPCKQKNKQAHTHTSSDPPSWNERTAVIAVYTTIPLCPLQGRTQGCKQENPDPCHMMEEKYLKEAWIRAYPDGSATDTIRNGRAGSIHPDPDGHTVAIATCSHCTNYRAEAEALKK